MSSGPRAHRLVVFGAGVMGTGIVATAVGHGVPTVVVDLTEEVLDTARARIEEQIRHAQLMGALPPDRERGELVLSVSPGDVEGATAVIEAITEDPGLKAKLLADVSTRLAPGVPLITNTSGIPVDELADSVARPEDLLGTHFMNPTYLIRMVEVIRGARTGDASMAAAGALLAALGREPVTVADAPGFVTSRLLHPMLNTAVKVVAAGTATAAEVDALMTGCLGHATGPLRTADLIGLDNLADSLAELYRRTGDASCRPAELLLRKVREGHLGRKSGRGFHDYGKAVP